MAVIGTAAMLAGCQSFPLTSWAFNNARPGSEQRLPALDPVTTLEEGKAHLRQGQIAAAIASFQIARSRQSTRAEADNGLAVAFALLGRFDLAQRYFQAASSSEPDNRKYTANLVRLRQQMVLASRSEAQAMAQPSRPPQQRSGDTNGRTAGPVQRVSHAEVLVRSLNVPAAPPTAVVSARKVPLKADATATLDIAEKTTTVGVSRSGPLTIAFGR
jgi:Tfp pilus assembly protein PilF